MFKIDFDVKHFAEPKETFARRHMHDFILRAYKSHDHISATNSRHTTAARGGRILTRVQNDTYKKKQYALTDIRAMHVNEIVLIAV